MRYFVLWGFIDINACFLGVVGPLRVFADRSGFLLHNLLVKVPCPLRLLYRSRIQRLRPDLRIESGDFRIREFLVLSGLYEVPLRPWTCKATAFCVARSRNARGGLWLERTLASDSLRGRTICNDLPFYVTGRGFY